MIFQRLSEKLLPGGLERPAPVASADCGAPNPTPAAAPPAAAAGIFSEASA